MVRPDRRHRDYDERVRLERVHAGPGRRDERARDPAELGVEGEEPEAVRRREASEEIGHRPG